MFGSLFILHVCRSLPVLLHLSLFPLPGLCRVRLFILSWAFLYTDKTKNAESSR